MDAAAICARWTADRANLSEGTWSGATATCTAGDMSADARANALRLVNLYRWLAALPPVTTDPAHDAEDQACALMMRANNMISHMPPTTWLCYTAAGADGASNSNVSGGPAVSSVDLYMTDPGNPTTIGHRRWLLSNSLGPIGIGGTDRSSCLWTLTGTGKAGKPWMAWPPAGIVPVQAVFAGGTKGGADTTGWTVESDTHQPGERAGHGDARRREHAGHRRAAARRLRIEVRDQLHPDGLDHAAEQDVLGGDHGDGDADLVHGTDDLV